MTSLVRGVNAHGQHVRVDVDLIRRRVLIEFPHPMTGLELSKTQALQYAQALVESVALLREPGEMHVVADRPLRG